MTRKEKIQYLKGIAAGAIPLKEGKVFDPLFVDTPNILRINVLQPGEESRPGCFNVIVIKNQAPGSEQTS